MAGSKGVADAPPPGSIYSGISVPPGGTIPAPIPELVIANVTYLDHFRAGNGATAMVQPPAAAIGATASAQPASDVSAGALTTKKRQLRVDSGTIIQLTNRPNAVEPY